MKLLAVGVKVTLGPILISIGCMVRIDRRAVRPTVGGYSFTGLPGLERGGPGSLCGGDGEQGRDGHELGMSGAVAGDVCGVHALGDDVAIVDQDTADGRLVCPKGKAGLRTTWRRMGLAGGKPNN